MAATIALTLVALAAGIESLVSLIGGMKDARGQPAPAAPDATVAPTTPPSPKPPSNPGHQPGATTHPPHDPSGRTTRQQTGEKRPRNQVRTPVPTQPKRPPVPSSDKPPVSSLGDLDKETVQLYINRHHQRIKHCYEQRLLVDPMLAGTVTAQFVVAPDGTVASSTASGLDDAVSRCIAGVIKDISFPRSGSSLKVTTPFQLVPSND